VNWEHLRTFFWLRWRLFLNQLKRGGIANAVILAVLAVAGVLLALVLFVTAFLAGLLLLPEASPIVHLYVWDGLAIVFMFWWGLGILTDLQRSEALSLDKFLHLPVSLTSAFLINYVSSMFSLSMVIFLPAMAGLILGLTLSLGPKFLALLPLLAAFLLMITALTYQFQGWLASLMANKRRRQTIIVAITMSMILFCQLPNLLNLFNPWKGQPQNEQATLFGKQQAELKRALDGGEITEEEYRERERKFQKEFLVESKKRSRQTEHTVASVARLANIALPPGWLPLGAMGIAEGNFLPALLGTIGLSLIGTASLWRAYRTTLRYYTGQFSAGGSKLADSSAAPASVPARPDPARVLFLERKFPWLSEPATAVALASFRSLLRAPEAKMMLLSPIFLVIVFGSMFMTRTMDPPDMLRPLFPFGAMALVLFSMIALVGNQFGFDRNGFRVYVLCPAPRQDILLGKNLAIAPLALGLGALLAILVDAMYPMRLFNLLAIPAQLISMFLVFCLLANTLSILAPMAIRAGSLKAAQPKGVTILLHLAFTFLFPLALSPTLLPLGLEILAQKLGALPGLPICLVLTLLECIGIGYFYRLVLGWQGAWLQSREPTILELVTVKSE
jgi:hypothetical protein